MHGRIKEDDSSAPRAVRRVLLLLADGGRPAVPHLLPQAQRAGRGRGAAAGRERAGRGPQLLPRLRLRAQPGQHLAGLWVDTTGARVFDLYVKDLRTGELVSGPIPNTGLGRSLGQR